MREAMLAAAELGVSWWVWRIVVSERIPDGLADVRRWRFVDLVRAHAALDALEVVDDWHRNRPRGPGGR